MPTLLAALLVAAGKPEPVEVAKSFLAQELGVAPGTLQVQRVQAAQWPDGSLGCGQPGETYVQVVTKGFEVALASRGQVYVVHVANGRAVLCQGRPRIGPPDDAAPKVGLLARRDLAARLGIDPKKIEPVSARPHVWPDASLGCPEPGMSYAQVETTGYIIELRAQGKKYVYHSDQRRAVSCEK